MQVEAYYDVERQCFIARQLVQLTAVGNSSDEARSSLERLIKTYAATSELLTALETALEQLRQCAGLVSDDDVDFLSAVELAETALASASGVVSSS